MSLSLLTVFGAGVLTFLTPCVLPLIPVYLAALTGGDVSNMDTKTRGQLFIRSIFFSIGFILIFTLMGLGASSIGAFLSDHKTALQGVGALLISVFALKFLGILNIPIMDRIVKADDTKVKTRFGSVNAFVMGIVFAAGWSPCVGPVLGTVLTYTASTTSSPLSGAAYLSLYGFGFALPLLATAAFAELGMKLIGKISFYLPKIEKGIGVVLLFIAGMLVFDIVQTSPLSSPSNDARSNDNASFSSIVDPENPLPVMVEFYKEDCPICQKMNTVIERLERECDKKGVHVRKVDISKPENRHLARKFRLVGVPTFVFLDEFETETARLVGEQTEKTLKQTISILRGEPCPGVAMITPEMLQNNQEQANPGCNI